MNYSITQPPPPKGKERPLRRVLAAVIRQRPGDADPACVDGIVYGLMLECGHYVERYTCPKNRGRCDACGEGAAAIQPLVVPCPQPHYPDGSVCQRCLGFGKIEQPCGDAPRPGSPGDHVCAVWCRCDGNFDTVTVLAKRGNRWLGEHRRVPHAGLVNDGEIVRFEGPANLSERNHIHAIEVQADGLAGDKRSFVEVRSTDHTRFRDLLNFSLVFLHPENAQYATGQKP